MPSQSPRSDQCPSLANSPRVLLFSVISYGVGYPLGQLRSADLAVSAPKSLCTSASSLAGQQEKLCFINIIFILKPKHSIVSAAKENINFNWHNQDKHYMNYMNKYMNYSGLDSLWYFCHFKRTTPLPFPALKLKRFLGLQPWNSRVIQNCFNSLVENKCHQS